MIEILPIRVLTDEDSPLFGALNVSLGKLSRVGLPVGSGIVITAPSLKLKTTLEQFDFKVREVFQQSLTLVEKEIKEIPPPQVLIDETNKHKKFLVNGQQIESAKKLWIALLMVWLEQIKTRLWSQGFYPGLTEDLDPQVVIFVKKVSSFGVAFFDSFQEEVTINVNVGQLHPNDQRKITELVQHANKKLFGMYQYQWMVDGGVKLIKVVPFTPAPVFETLPITVNSKADKQRDEKNDVKSAIKVFFDLSLGLTIEKNVDGIYISAEKIFDLNKPSDSFENLVFKLVESAITFPGSPVLLKLADKSEGMGKVRGSLRLLHQKNLLDPLLEALDFARHKKGLNNIHVVIPFIRNTGELLQIKRELAIKKLVRKNSLQIWMEVAVLENIINLENYLLTGVDGVVLNLDELIAHLNGFDPEEGELAFYKNEVEGLLKFLEDGIRLLHKSKIPFIAYGSLSLHQKVLEFLIEKGVYGVVIDRYEAHSAHELLHQTEKRILLRRSV